jgi:hypothetical protein
MRRVHFVREGGGGGGPQPPPPPPPTPPPPRRHAIGRELLREDFAAAADLVSRPAPRAAARPRPALVALEGRVGGAGTRRVRLVREEGQGVSG